MEFVRELLVSEDYFLDPDPVEEQRIIEIISKLQILVQQYADSIFGEVPVQCVIHPYGSYRMGSRMKKVDIDCCLILCHHHHTNQEQIFSLVKLATFLKVVYFHYFFENVFRIIHKSFQNFVL